MVGTLFNSSSTVLMLKTKVDFISNQNLLSKPTTTTRSLKCNGRQVHGSDSSPILKQSNDKVLQSRARDSLCAHRFCPCGRRRLMEAIGTSFFAIPSSSASPPPLDDPEDVLNSIHPPRPDCFSCLGSHGKFTWVGWASITKLVESTVGAAKTDIIADDRVRHDSSAAIFFWECSRSTQRDIPFCKYYKTRGVKVLLVQQRETAQQLRSHSPSIFLCVSVFGH